MQHDWMSLNMAKKNNYRTCYTTEKNLLLKFANEISMLSNTILASEVIQSRNCLPFYEPYHEPDTSLHILKFYFMTTVWLLTFNLCLGPPGGILLSDFPPETLQAFLTVTSKLLTPALSTSLIKPSWWCLTNRRPPPPTKKTHCAIVSRLPWLFVVWNRTRSV